MAEFGRYCAVKWFKRYAIGCLIWLVLGGIHDGYERPGQGMRWGAIVVVAGVWPIVTAVIVGSTVGEIAHDIRQGKNDA
jgi:hypothetical protein